jgi:lysophospholipase L1-like esterase
MNKMRLYFSVIWFLCLLTGTAVAQPFAEEIRAFKKIDNERFPPKKAILFVGSSSFRKWTDVQDYFPGYTIINRGFGGSTLPDVIRYANDIIIPYAPRQVVIYCGENDLASSDTVTSNIVLERFKTLFYLIRNQLPRVPILFVALKPSPSRQKLWPAMLEANVRIRQFLKHKRRTAYADVYHAMLNSDGTLIPGLFLEDNLHMTAKGYAIWQKIINPYLLKD